jgi:ribosomal protein S18 acetylase RimI-like enzyme
MDTRFSSSSISSSPPSPKIRTAALTDLVEAAAVYQSAAHALFDERRASDPWASEDARRIDVQAAIDALGAISSADPDAVKVSEHDGAIIALGAVVIRERHAHILFLFVDPEWQHRGIGHALLNELRRVIAEAGCTVISLTASEDRRAWRRYLAMGLQPGAPIISMRAPVAIFPEMPEMPENDGLMTRAVSSLQPDALDAIDKIDKAVKGARRRSDLEHWISAEGATGAVLLQESTGLPVGYYLVSGDARYGRIGPVASLQRDRFGDVLHRALRAAGNLEGAARLV